MKWERRVLIVSAPNPHDTALSEQRRTVASWKAKAADRDLTIVEIIADKVVGATDPATTLRSRYRLPSARFSVVLIGKDGQDKLRASRPISAALLEATIDAMPMRRAGER